MTRSWPGNTQSTSIFLLWIPSWVVGSRILFTCLPPTPSKMPSTRNTTSSLQIVMVVYHLSLLHFVRDLCMSPEVRQAMLTFVDFSSAKELNITKVRMLFRSMVNSLVCVWCSYQRLCSKYFDGFVKLHQLSLPWYMFQYLKASANWNNVKSFPLLLGIHLFWTVSKLSYRRPVMPTVHFAQYSSGTRLLMVGHLLRCHC